MSEIMVWLVWLVLGLAIVVAASAASVAVVALRMARLLDDAHDRSSAQIDRLFVLQRSESMAEFAAANRQLERSRLEAARAEIVGGDAAPATPGVARLPRARSNRLGIWSRVKVAAAPETPDTRQE